MFARYIFRLGKRKSSLIHLKKCVLVFITKVLNYLKVTYTQSWQLREKLYFSNKNLMKCLNYGFINTSLTSMKQINMEITKLIIE